MSSLPTLHNRGQPINQGTTLGSQWPGRLHAAICQASKSPSHASMWRSLAMYYLL